MIPTLCLSFLKDSYPFQKATDSFFWNPYRCFLPPQQPQQLPPQLHSPQLLKRRWPEQPTSGTNSLASHPGSKHSSSPKLPQPPHHTHPTTKGYNPDCNFHTTLTPSLNTTSLLQKPHRPPPHTHLPNISIQPKPPELTGSRPTSKTHINTPTKKHMTSKSLQETNSG